MGNPSETEGLRDFTLSNARRFYSSMGNPSETEGLRDFTLSNARRFYSSMGNPSDTEGLRDFTLSNARRFYSSMGNPSDTEGLRDVPRNLDPLLSSTPAVSSKRSFQSEVFQHQMLPPKRNTCTDFYSRGTLEPKI